MLSPARFSFAPTKCPRTSEIKHKIGSHDAFQLTFFLSSEMLVLSVVLRKGGKIGYNMVWFGFITGPCDQERLKVQYTEHRTFSMADSLTVCITPS